MVKEERKMKKKRKPRSKIFCPYCNAVSYTLTQYYAHLKTCEAGKKWSRNKKCWEQLQYGK